MVGGEEGRKEKEIGSVMEGRKKREGAEVEERWTSGQREKN